MFVDQPITITCIAWGTQILAWESDEYIGHGGQLAFGPGDMEGTIAGSDVMEQTYAILTRSRAMDDNSKPQLPIESQLHLTVVSKYQTFTITCRNVDLGLADSITYHISGEHRFKI